MKGRVFKISRFAVNDGDGIRTTVFLSGCPLRCRWCHNPEGFDARGGEEITADELMKTLVADRSFYETSGGGVTLSGGEPTFQHEFCAEILKKLKTENIHSAVETSGMCDARIFSSLAPLADMFLFDCKLLDKEKLFYFTGGDAEIIAENLQTLERLKKSVILRCPIIPTVNDDEKHLMSVAALADSLSCVREVHLLPYHDFGVQKYAELSLPAYKYALIKPNRAEEIFSAVKNNCRKKVIYFSV